MVMTPVCERSAWLMVDLVCGVVKKLAHGLLTAVSMPLLMQVHTYTCMSVALNTHGCFNEAL